MDEGCVGGWGVGVGVGGDYNMPSIHVSVHLFIVFLINLNMTGNIYGYKNMSVQNFSLTLKKKKNGHHSQSFENHKDALNIKILQLV